MNEDLVASSWRRAVVHPWTITTVLAVLAITAAAFGLLAAASPVILLSAWLLAAMAAGFAISGSV